MTSWCLTFEKSFFNSLEFNVNLTHFMPLVSFYTLKIIRKREVVDIFKGFRKTSAMKVFNTSMLNSIVKS